MRFLAPRGLAGLGWGLPLAIGAKVADPNYPVVGLVSVSFAHSWAELETLVRSLVAVTVILLNNGVLGFQRDAATLKRIHLFQAGLDPSEIGIGLGGGGSPNNSAKVNRLGEGQETLCVRHLRKALRRPIQTSR